MKWSRVEKIFTLKSSFGVSNGLFFFSFLFSSFHARFATPPPSASPSIYFVWLNAIPLISTAHRLPFVEWMCPQWEFGIRSHTHTQNRYSLCIKERNNIYSASSWLVCEQFPFFASGVSYVAHNRRSTTGVLITIINFLRVNESRSDVLYPPTGINSDFIFLFALPLPVALFPLRITSMQLWMCVMSFVQRERARYCQIAKDQ